MTNGGRVDNLAFQNTCMESTYTATGPPQDNAELQKNMMDSNSQGMANKQAWLGMVNTSGTEL
jgi:hypothetical protein